MSLQLFVIVLVSSSMFFDNAECRAVIARTSSGVISIDPSSGSVKTLVNASAFGPNCSIGVGFSLFGKYGFVVDNVVALTPRFYLLDPATGSYDWPFPLQPFSRGVTLVHSVFVDASAGFLIIGVRITNDFYLFTFDFRNPPKGYPLDDAAYGMGMGYIPSSKKFYSWDVKEDEVLFFYVGSVFQMPQASSFPANLSGPRDSAATIYSLIPDPTNRRFFFSQVDAITLNLIIRNLYDEVGGFNMATYIDTKIQILDSFDYSNIFSLDSASQTLFILAKAQGCKNLYVFDFSTKKLVNKVSCFHFTDADNFVAF